MSVLRSTCLTAFNFLFVNRADYFSEAKMMACLKDPNIVSLLGVCCNDDPVCVVLEYMKHGDLNQFLQVHVAAESSLVKSGTGLVQMKALRYKLHSSVDLLCVAHVTFVGVVCTDLHRAFLMMTQ